MKKIIKYLSALNNSCIKVGVFYIASSCTNTSVIQNMKLSVQLDPKNGCELSISEADIKSLK